MSEALEQTKAFLDVLGKRQVTTSLSTLAVALAGLLLVGGLYVHSVRSYERILAKAEERETRYEQQLEKLEQKWAVDRARILELTEQQAKVQARVVYRDREADKKIAEVSKPDRTVEQVSYDVVQAYGFAPVEMYGNNLVFAAPQVQEFVVTRMWPLGSMDTWDMTASAPEP